MSTADAEKRPEDRSNQLVLWQGNDVMKYKTLLFKVYLVQMHLLGTQPKLNELKMQYIHYIHMQYEQEERL